MCIKYVNIIIEKERTFKKVKAKIYEKKFGLEKFKKRIDRKG